MQIHAKDTELIKQMQSFFGVGRINFNLNNNKTAVAYNVSSLESLINYIIPHFEKYPLLTQKKGDFILFKSAIELMIRKEHLTDEGLRKLLAIKASINKGLSDTLKEHYPDIVPVERPTVDIPLTIDAN